MCTFVESFGPRFIMLVESAAVLAARSSGLIHISQDSRFVLWTAMSVCCCVVLQCIRCSPLCRAAKPCCSSSNYSILIMSETSDLFAADCFSVLHCLYHRFIELLLLACGSCQVHVDWSFIFHVHIQVVWCRFGISCVHIVPFEEQIFNRCLCVKFITQYLLSAVMAQHFDLFCSTVQCSAVLLVSKFRLMHSAYFVCESSLICRSQCSLNTPFHE